MEFGWIPPGIRSDSSRIGIQADPSDSGGNGGNLVGIWWEWIPVQVKFGWVSTDMIFLPNSDHSYHSAWIPPGSGWNVRGRVKYSCHVLIMMSCLVSGAVSWCHVLSHHDYFCFSMTDHVLWCHVLSLESCFVSGAVSWCHSLVWCHDRSQSCSRSHATSVLGPMSQMWPMFHFLTHFKSIIIWF